MKFKFSKITAFVLCLSLLVSCVLPSFGAAGENTQYISSIDFEDKAYAESVLETKQLATADVSEDYSLITEGKNTYLRPAKASARLSPFVTTFKDDVWQTSQLTEFKFTFKLEAEKESYDDIVTFYAFLREDGASAAGLRIFTWKNQIFFRSDIRGDKITTTLDTGNLAGWYFDDDETLTVTASYDYNDWANGKVTVDYHILSDKKDDNGNYKTQTIKGAVYTFADTKKALPCEKIKVGFGSSSTDETVLVDDVSVTFGETLENTLCGWYLQNEVLLSKNASTFNESTDLAAWNAAASYYNNASAEMRALMVSYGFKEKLISMRGSEPKAVAKYKTDHAYVISLTRETATNADIEKVAAAITDYNSLDTLSKLYLEDIYEGIKKINAYVNAYITPKKDDYDTSTITATFEGEVNPFVNIIEEPDEDAKFEFRADPFGEGDDVFYAENWVNAVYLVDEKYWPAQCQPTTVSFKFYWNDINVFSRPNFLLSYFDEENYSYVQFDQQIAWYNKVVNGITSGDRMWYLQEESQMLDWSSWVTFTLKYSPSGLVTVTAEDAQGSAASGTAYYTPGGNIGFRFIGEYGIRGKHLYIDDFSVSFTEGDFDLNEPLEELGIRALYTGNTYVGANETLFISGERLGKTVDKAYIMKLNDVIGGELSYIAQENVLTDGMDYYDALYAKDPKTKWVESKAKEMKILQRSELSLNTVIPADIGDGVYIVKLTSLIDGVADRYIYVNAPYVSFINGDEGEIATAGGTIRIVGHNLNTKYLDGDNTGATVKMKNLETGEIITISGENVKGFGDNSALEAALPTSIKGGKYAVYVHSGIGDETAYSVPEEITIGENPRNSWGLERVFNVRDTRFAGGAKGDGNTNDTPAFLEALTAAYEAGGGTVYVPAGSYRVLSTLPIPQNVHLKGESNGNTMIFWTARRWDLGKLPDAHIRILGNCEISDIYFYGTRVSRFISNTDAVAGNVYIHDIRTNFVWYAGNPTNGGSTSNTGKLTYQEVAAAVFAEMSGESKHILALGDKTLSNVQLYDISLENPRITQRELVLEAHHSRVSNVGKLQNWIGFGGTAMVVEDCEFSGCIGPSVNGLYYARNYNFGTGGNNKELMTTDGGPKAENRSIQLIGDKPELMQAAGLEGETDSVTYRFIGYAPKDDSFLNHTIVVQGGQGIGQARKIVWQKGEYFRIEKPFAVTPNRNSNIKIVQPRMTMQFINSHWQSGDAVGTYGAMVDGVFDGNTFADFGTQVFDNIGSLMWYISVVNGKYTDPVYVHGDGAGNTLHEDDIYSLAMKLNGSANFGNIGLLWRDNDIDGYWFELTSGTNENSLEGLVIENNSLYNITCNHSAVTIRSDTRLYNNVLLRNNLFDVDDVYSEKASAALNTETNKYGSFKLMSDYTLPENIKDRLGDVNLDGKISIKDSTLIKLYYVGLIELSEEQLINADVNDDDKVDLKDASQIRRYVLTGEEFITSKDDSWIDAEY